MSRRPSRTDSRKQEQQRSEAELVREFAAIMRDTGLTEIEFEQGEIKIKLSRATQLLPAPAAYAAPPAALPPPPAALPPPTAAPEPAAAPEPRNNPNAVTSPMVGTAYLSPEPGAPVFVKVGDTVTEGQTLMVVEAMKTFNPIPAPRAGRVTQILVADAQPVEFGEALIVLE